MRRLTRFLLIALALFVAVPNIVAAGDEAEVALEFALARSLSAEGSIAEALVAWQQLVVRAPEEPYIRIEYARFLSRIGRHDQAVEQAEMARDLVPTNPDVLRGAVDVLVAAGRATPEHLEAAREALELLVALQPGDVEALFQLGRAYHEMGRFEEASVWLDRAARRHPSNRTLQSFRIDALLQSQQEAAAEAALVEYLRYDAAFLRGRLQLAMLQSERGDHLAAASSLRSAPAEQLGDRELRWQLAGQLYRLGELDEGVETIDSLLANDPEAFRERMLKGMMLSAQGHDPEALEVYRGLRLERPLNLDIVSKMVEGYERLGRFDSAEELLREVEERLIEAGGDRRLMQLRFELMSHLWRAEAWDRLAEVAEPLAGNPDSPLQAQGVLYLSDALHAVGDSEEALKLLKKSAGSAVSEPRSIAKRAEILADLGRDKEAESLLEGLDRASDLSSLLAAAEVYHRQERYPEAIAVLTRALEVDPLSSQALYWLGAALERSGDRVQAAETFAELLEQNPRHAPTLNYLGYMWAEQGERLDEALGMVMSAVAQEPDNGAYVDSLGWAHYQRGDYVRARELLERAARLVPDDAVVSEHLGDVYAQLGEAERAIESYRRALQLDGDNREAVQRKIDRLTVQR